MHRYVCIVIMYIHEVDWVGVGWICLAEDRGQWQAVVYLAIFSFHKFLSGFQVFKEDSAPKHFVSLDEVSVQLVVI